PFGDLSGAGVAFKLAWAIAQKFSQAQKVSESFKNFLMESIALVALGTVADVVPLIGENRIFVRQGLRHLQATPTIGLKALLQAAELGDKVLDAGHIGFSLAPRLNAAGRLGQARLAIELLATSNHTRAVDLARYLNEQNEKRQTVERRIASQAKEMVEAM
ncbi:MAG TPA: single-stranded-DNA-specific exonuclease RecJ, partial [Gemmatales bacterium]|nr:single-stranded-DNA-specific exonuclease RecJ [Gemmatales bacterium]